MRMERPVLDACMTAATSVTWLDFNDAANGAPEFGEDARELRVREKMFVARAFWHHFGYPDALFSARELRHGIHAGDIETSLMMAFRDDLVRRDDIANFEPASLDMEERFQWLRATGPHGFGWMSQDLSPAGAMGNAALATLEKGEASADYGATAFLELLQDIEAFDLARLADGPLD